MKRSIGLAMVMVWFGAVALGCSDEPTEGDGDGNAGGSGGSGGEVPCAEECNAAECPAEVPAATFGCEQAGLACSYTFEGCVIDFACVGPGSTSWQATAPSGCEIPQACGIEGVAEGAACTTVGESCDIACSECRMECGEDHRWHESCAPVEGDCG